MVTALGDVVYSDGTVPVEPTVTVTGICAPVESNTTTVALPVMLPVTVRVAPLTLALTTAALLLLVA